MEKQSPYYQASQTHTLVVHKSPHVEEYFALVMLKNYGEKRGFPGTKTAKIEFWDAGSSTPDGKSWKDWHQKGYLLIGVGGSCFDEHSNSKESRKEGECAATLVVKALGMIDEPWLEKILRYVTINDLKGGHNPYELGGLIGSMNNECFEEDPLGTTEWAMQIICVLIKKEFNFFNKTGEEFKACSETFEAFHKGRKVIVSVIQSDDKRIAAFARSTLGVNADVVVQRNSKGNVYISTQKRSMICLDEVAKAVRIEEMKLAKTNRWYDDRQLFSEGNLPGSECWYYDKQASRIFNGGGTSNTSVSATLIPFKKIVTMLQFGLQKDFRQRPVFRKQNNRRA